MCVCVCVRVMPRFSNINIAFAIIHHIYSLHTSALCVCVCVCVCQLPIAPHVGGDVCVCVCGTPNDFNNLKAFAIIQHLSTAMFALQQCLDLFARRDLPSLSARHEIYEQSPCSYRTLCVCVCACALYYLRGQVAFKVLNALAKGKGEG